MVAAAAPGDGDGSAAYGTEGAEGAGGSESRGGTEGAEVAEGEEVCGGKLRGDAVRCGPPGATLGAQET